VIKGLYVLSFYPDFESAYRPGVAEYGISTDFLVKTCETNIGARTRLFRILVDVIYHSPARNSRDLKLYGPRL
jgi:hypothetical protein